MPNTIRVFLIDDEPSFREVAKLFLAADCPEVVIVGEAGSLSEATKLLPQASPDLLLLDIDLGDGTGFDLLDRFPQPNFKVVFTTAHDEFALRAFRYSALDYLLKPVDPVELTAAVRKAAIPGEGTEHRQQLQYLSRLATTRQFDRIALNTGSGLLFVGTEEMLRLEANGNYSFVFLENGERHLVAQSLTGFESLLPSPPFFRAHQSHIINLKFVRKLDKDDGDRLQMTDKSIVPLARRRKDAFVEMMR
ncbi:MAG: LytTR family DNA-binding domain-containing protein [Saprospiraceae bacterium]|nr:LytTR family DNA-binding domain-containing protein [Saprospiraceae bacterium]